MTKKKEKPPEVKDNYNGLEEIKIERPKRSKLTAEESLQRMKDFEKRKEDFIASIRQSKG